MELCNLPLDRLMGYLVEAGGRATTDRSVQGQHWSATLVEMEPAQVSVIRVPRDLLVIEGDDVDAVERVQALMRRRTMRGGG